ncbi:response regulator transcription factor [Methylobacterium dankookense]|uniref:Virulence factors putative positive transcription regulator BvgA n=1 Tax=Methylobacterium dankookense TaxID=560405 RepID=A0A564FWR6_9HYPH|nr:response regulator transcription factor [Methylobacterium dankookense]GJD55922.1 Virulence factors putative positive transcription regulator BvgA [Methylobacterium dankookense]VUF12563.1 Virulence factors putative positive transcription regulator BvgA [Methylobacterium dankookense]
MKGPTTIPPGTRVLIVDDHPIVRQGIRRILEDAGVASLFEAGDPVAGYRLFHRIRPDIAVVDLAFEGNGLAGLSLIRRMRALEAKARILVLSMHRDPVIAARCLEAGASGFMFKDLPVQDFLEAFASVRQNHPHLPHPLATAIAALNQSFDQQKHSALNARELQIYILMKEGTSYRNIADRLSIGYRSVVNSCSSIRKKLESPQQAK